MSNQPDICLGCGSTFLGAFCLKCEVPASQLIRNSHWPLETSLSLAALAEVEIAIRAHLDADATYDGTAATISELTNLASNIRAHLQHVKTFTKKDPLLL